MNDTPDQTGTTRVESEEWFLEQLEQPEIPVPVLVDSLNELAAGGGFSQAEARAKLLQDMLAEKGGIDDALGILQLRAGWMPSGADSLAAVRDEALAVLGPDAQKRGLVDFAGFDRSVPAAEGVRRLRVLLGLAANALCYARTWGAGVIRRVDEYAKRVEVDFETRKGHQFSFAFAAESLQMLEPGHLLACFHRDPAAVRALVAQQPGELVRMALRSFGPLTVVQLQEILAPRFFSEAEWKAFWEAARRELKKDALVEIPAKRTEPIHLRARGMDFGPEWFRALGAERDMKTVLLRIGELAGAGGAAPDAPAREVLIDRLAFVIKGAGVRHPGLAARAALAAADFGLEGERVNLGALLAQWRQPAFFLATVADLPARDVRPFLELLSARLGAEFQDYLLSLLERMEIGSLSEAIELLEAAGRGDAVADLLRGLFATQTVDVEALLWVYRHSDRWEEWALGLRPDLARLTLNALEKEHAYERLKAQNQLRERFARPEWLKELFDSMSDDQRREFFLRLKDTPAWPQLERQSLLGRIVKLYPETEALLREQPGTAAPVRKAVLTSMHSYRERQMQLQKLVHEEIPKNSRDIGHARSYGDLKENHEFKAAKEMQSMLMRRQAEFEAQLREVQPSDFEGFPVERAGVATGIEIERADGVSERYYILGAWDRDERLGIVSSSTRLAQTLEGLRAGDTFALPTATGEISATVKAVIPLPEEVRRWIRGEA